MKTDLADLVVDKLKWLRLPGMAEQLKALLDKIAAENLSALQLVDRLCDEEKQSRLLTAVVAEPRAKLEQTSDSFRFAAAVASFGMLLRDSPSKGDSSFPAVLKLAHSALQPDPGGHRQEFTQLVQIAERLATAPGQARKD